MVDEHAKANSELKQLAPSKGIELPATLDEAHRAEIDRLSKLSGTDFDHAYVRAMVRDHDEDVAEFQKQLKSAHDVELQAWVSKTLPTLTEHQEMIHMIARDLPAPPKKSS
jgi:putative membrane protein